jgi:uncharacterized membrane protein YbhN (UPF0104 family)
MNKLAVICGVCFILVFMYLSWRLFDLTLLTERFRAVLLHPGWLLLMTAAYAMSFVFKAAAWRIYADREQPLAVYVHGIHYSLLVNHVLPFKAGDLVRAGVLMKFGRKRWDIAFHSVAVMRLLDLLVLGAISVAGMLWLGLSISWITVSAAAVLAALTWVFMKFVAVRRWAFASSHYHRLKQVMLSKHGVRILAFVAFSWILEAAILYGIFHICGIPLGAASAIWANSVTVGGQIFQVMPGGIGTYESVLSGTLFVLGVSMEDAYLAAILTHALKFAAAFALGFYSILRMPIGWRLVREWMRLRRKPVVASLNKASRKEAKIDGHEFNS